MNLRTTANRLTRRVNPNMAAQVKVCTGYTTSASGKRAPAYAATANLTIQMQALEKSEIEHLDALNFSHCTTAIYADRVLTGVDRTTQSGGDLILVGGDTWLVTTVLEQWSGQWCKVAATRQLP